MFRAKGLCLNDPLVLFYTNCLIYFRKKVLIVQLQIRYEIIIIAWLNFITIFLDVVICVSMVCILIVSQRKYPIDFFCLFLVWLDPIARISLVSYTIIRLFTLNGCLIIQY